MFQIEKTKKNGGMILWVDEQSLREMHKFILDLSEKSPVLNSEGLTLALAHDIRKAYSSSRKTAKANVGDDEITIFGVKQVWPTLLMQVALLRTGLAFVNSSKQSQCLMYQLEAIIEDSVNSFLTTDAINILSQYEQLIGIQEKFITERIGSRVSYFLSLESEQRRKQLAEVLHSLGTMWESTHNIVGSERMDGTLTPERLKRHSWDSVTDCEF